ncbi:type IA DNA topoisomerase [Bacillus smithii]|uniref:type IA DNA topoisomerase n=1 Tax=Bacillus smithii TaxID=1479 RepID=UPI00077BE2A9|nr:type IA DNA topoisomerase [Bacillus smithii]
MLEVFVCEKPIQAENIGKALSKSLKRKDGYYEGVDGRIYTYALGHLVETKKPEEINPNWGWGGDISHLPFFIQDIPLKLKEKDGIKKQFEVIVNWMKKADIIVNATDAGREGQHIFMKIYKMSNIKGKKIKRLWARDQSESGIKKAYAAMKDNEDYAGMTLAGQLREESDLLIGLNATQLATKLSGSKHVISFGRVQTPTLAMIVKRDETIENFKSVKHYNIVAPTNLKDEEGKKKVFEMKLEKDEKLTKDQAMERLKGLSVANRTHYNLETQTVKEKPKNLFSLTTLQMHMNGKYGFTAKKTLVVLQALYEKHKLVTYPRTEAEHLASDEDLPAILSAHKDHEFLREVVANGWKMEPSFIDPSKVTDHEAIIPTTKNATGVDLSEDEKTLYREIMLRFAQSFYPEAVYTKYTATFQDGEETFQTGEKVLIEPGFLVLEGKKPGTARLESLQLEDIGDYEIREKETQPPKRYTEKSLLEDMKNAAKLVERKEDKAVLKKVEGIGTPATRSEIIELLKTRKFIEEKGKHLVSTPLGRELIHMMPDDFSLYSALLTADFETKLSMIENQTLTKQEYYDQLKVLIETITKEIRANMKPIQFAASEQKEAICQCPQCGKPVYENSKAYSCSGFKEGCKITVWKNGLERFGKKKISKTEAKKLLEGKIIKVKLKSKSGNPYEKEVRYNPEKQWIEFIK